MKNSLYIMSLAFLFASSLLISSCKKDEEIIPPTAPENEFITTCVLKLINSADSTDSQIARWTQIDPTGANPPDTSLAILNLKKNSTYKCEVLYLDETKTPFDTISNEVRDRQNYHAVFYLIGNSASNLTINRTDYDTNNPPLLVGLNADFITSSTIASTYLRVVLRHQPNGKDGTYTPGTTDAETGFTINIIN